jgi:POT family proton-dependent oligopeptide transporter
MTDPIRSDLPGKHQPWELYLLSGIAVSERAASAAMLALLPVYLSQHLGFSDGTSVLIAGVFAGLAYLASLLGGHLGDGPLGLFRTLRFGILALTFGAAAMALDRAALLWGSLALLIFGHGLFKPCLTTLVGKLYGAHDTRRDGGFAVFYFAINIGFLIGPLVGEWSRARFSWRAVFVAAAVLMLPSLVLAVAGSRHIECSARYIVDPNHTASPRNQPERIRAAASLCVLAVLSWFAMQQTSGVLVLFAEHSTRLHLALWRWELTLRPGYFTALHSGLVLAVLPLMMRRSRRQRALGEKSATVIKLVLGLICLAAAFALMGLAGLCGGDAGRVSPLWLVGCYILITPGEIWLSAMGLSLMTQLAPSRIASRLIGLWLAAVAVGSALAGMFGLLWSRWSHHRYFAVVALCCLLGACVLLARLRRIEAVLAYR